MSMPTEYHSGKRLIPDLSDEIEVGGQKLMRVKRVKAALAAASPAAVDAAGAAESPGAPASESFASLEELAKKHLVDSQVLEENADILRALADPEGASSHIQDLANRFELYTTDSPVPPSDPDPEKREGVTMSPIVGAEEEAKDFLTGREPPETLQDLFAMFPLDGDSWYIHVERKEPKLFCGIRVNGRVRNITRPISLDEWQEIYGGGTYRLIVYGPPKRGLVMQADGRVIPKKMTEPITVIFPGRPSLECMEDLEDKESRMTQTVPESMLPSTGRQRQLTPADASVEVKRIEKTADREIRAEGREEKERERSERLIREKQSSESHLLTKFLEMQEKAAEREAQLRTEMLEREREVAEQRRLDDEKWEERIRRISGESKKPDDIERIVTLAGAINKPDGSIDALREQHARELERLQRSSKDDAERVAERLREETARADRRIVEAEGRASERVKEVERRFGDLERELRERADREVQRAKEDSERRVNDTHRQHTDAMASETRNHARDIESLKAQHAMAMESMKNTYEMRLETARGEVKRTGADAERFRQEAESNKDVVGKLRKMKEDALELGMVEASDAAAEPETVGQSLIRMGAGLVGQIPGIVESVTSMAKGRDQQALLAARDAERVHMIEQAAHVPQQLPRAHRPRQLNPSELRHMSQVPPPPPRRQSMDPVVSHPPQSHQGLQPMPQPAPMPYQPNPMEHGPVVEFGAIQPAPAPQGHGSMPLADPAPVQQPPSMPPPPPAPVPDQAVEAAARQEDRNILEGEPILAAQYNSGASPELLAQNALAQYPREVIVGLLQNLGSADRVILAVERSGSPNSPFARRDGKKFLRALFSALTSALGAG